MQSVISVDDHVVEPPTLWTSRLSRKYADGAPHVVRDTVANIAFDGSSLSMGFQSAADGMPADLWVYEGVRYPYFRISAAVGFDIDDWDTSPITYEAMRPGCYEPAARLADMDLAGIDRSLCFPNLFVRFCGQTFYYAKDKELAAECVKAYNDWIVEEWCGGSGGRLIPLCIVPLWDPQLAAAEVRRNAGRGVRSVCFSEMPAYLGLPSIHTGHWDPFLKACEETQTVISMHIGSGSRLLDTSDDAPAGVGHVLAFGTSMMALTDWLLSGIFERYPTLKVLMAECQIGWVPYLLQRADQVWHNARARNELRDKLTAPPSTYVRDHVYCVFFDDPVGLANLQLIGEDNVLFETDYPHADTTWPNCGDVAEKLTSGLDERVRDKILRTNAINLLGLDR